MRAQLRIDEGAIERNVRTLTRLAARSELCAVVKADGYGHGMVAAALAALAGGATWLAVAAVSEGVELRSALAAEGHGDVPVLVLGSLTAAEVGPALDAGLELSAWTAGFVDEVAASARERGVVAALHVKLDTGLGRLGTRDAAQADAVAQLAASAGGVRHAAGWTHFATADEPESAFFDLQLATFTRWGEALRARHGGVLLHAANSAAVFRDTESHLDLVRCGVAIYGLDPFGEDGPARGLHPAMSVVASIGAVKRCGPGESTGYGRRFVAPQATTIATVPVGYGDGYRRSLGDRADVLIGGRRCPVRGTVSMDNITVDAGALAAPPQPGDEVVLLGSQGAERVSAEQLAALIDTINYEITCGFHTVRLPRVQAP